MKKLKKQLKYDKQLRDVERKKKLFKFEKDGFKQYKGGIDVD